MSTRSSCATRPRARRTGSRRGRSASVVNAGDGRHEHPTQALLDAFTLRRHRGPSLDGCRVAIVGDIANSRVARSNVIALHALGCDLTLVGPPTLMPPRLDGWPVTVSYDLDDVLPDVDVVYLLRIQLERIDHGGDVRFPTLREYSSRWGLTAERAARLKPDTLVMHPGPDEPRRRDRRRGRRLHAARS